MALLDKCVWRGGMAGRVLGMLDVRGSYGSMRGLFVDELAVAQGGVGLCMRAVHSIHGAGWARVRARADAELGHIATRVEAAMSVLLEAEEAVLALELRGQRARVNQLILSLDRDVWVRAPPPHPPPRPLSTSRHSVGSRQRTEQGRLRLRAPRLRRPRPRRRQRVPVRALRCGPQLRLLLPALGRCAARASAPAQPGCCASRPRPGEFAPILDHAFSRFSLGVASFGSR
eukprot:2953514-Rhodomonas_salina.1